MDGEHDNCNIVNNSSRYWNMQKRMGLVCGDGGGQSCLVAAVSAFNKLAGYGASLEQKSTLIRFFIPITIFSNRL